MKQSRENIHKRHIKIIELLKEHHSLHITTLSELLNVSVITLRRDLILLEQEKLIIRFHGGAKLSDPNQLTIPTFDNKSLMHHEKKELIAQQVASFINPKDTIFINGGSTTLEVIKLLVKTDITIVTNHVLASTYIKDSKATLICTGGICNFKTESYVGELSTLIPSNINANLCILGVNGITNTDGITTANYPETMINQLFLSRCKGLCIVVADGSKVGKTYSYTSSSLSHIDVLITDSSAPTHELTKLRSKNITVITV